MARWRRIGWLVATVALLAGTLALPFYGRAEGLDWWVQWPEQTGTTNQDGRGVALVVREPTCEVWVPSGMRFDTLTVCWRWECSYQGKIGCTVSAPGCWEQQEDRGVYQVYRFFSGLTPGYYQFRAELRRGLRLWHYQMRVLVLPRCVVRE